MRPDDLPDPDLVGVAPRAGREPARLDSVHSPPLLHAATREGRFSFLSADDHHRPHHRSPHPARGVCPPAHDRSRVVPARVGRPGAARSSLVRRLRRPARLLRGGRDARRAGGRLPRLRPHREARADGAAAGAGPDVPESRFVVADVFLRFDHVTGTADVLRGDATRSGRGCFAQTAVLDEPTGQVGAIVRFPDRAEHERRVERVKQHIRRGDAFQVVLSQRAERPTGATPLARLPRPAPDQPVAVPLPARARRPRSRRLLARDARQGRGLRARASTRSPARRRAARATPSGCSPPTRTGPST